MFKKSFIAFILLLVLSAISTFSVYGYTQDISYEKFFYTGSFYGTWYLWSPCRDAYNNEDYRSVTSKYNNPRALSSSPHGGVDFSTGAGRNVYSIGYGKVVSKNTSTIDPNFGYYVVIQLDVNQDASYDNVYARFAHLQSSPVSVGQVVTPTTIIGVTGSTGTSSAHLHADMRNNNSTSNGVIRHIPWQAYYGNVASWNYGKDLDWASVHGGTGRTISIYCYGKTDTSPYTYAPDVIYLYVREYGTANNWTMYAMQSLGSYQYSYTIPTGDFANGTTVEWFVGARRGGISSSYCDWGLYPAKYRAPQMEDGSGNPTVPSSAISFRTYLRTL